MQPLKTKFAVPFHLNSFNTPPVDTTHPFASVIRAAPFSRNTSPAPYPSQRRAVPSSPPKRPQLIFTIAFILTTMLLTLLTSVLQAFVYHLAVRPILVRHNIIPPQQLPETLPRAIHGKGRRVRLGSGEFDVDARVRNLEETYRDDDDDDDEEAVTAGEGILTEGEYRDEER